MYYRGHRFRNFHSRKLICPMQHLQISVSIWVIGDVVGEHFPCSKPLLVWIPSILTRFIQSPELPSKPRSPSFHIVLSCNHAFIGSSMPAIDLTAGCVSLDIMLNAVAVMKYKSRNTTIAQALLLVITSAPRTTLSIHQIPRTVVPTVLRP